MTSSPTASARFSIDVSSRVSGWLIAAACALPVLWWMSHLSTVFYTADSWSYYDLARTVFSGDFYHPSTTRSFQEIEGYSRSFPLLWPVLIAIFDAIFGLGPRTGTALAAVCALLTVIPLRLIVQRSLASDHLQGYATAAVFLGLIAYTPYWAEVTGGRAIPLTILWLASATALLLNGKRGLATGLLLGCACLARFDALVVAVVMLALQARTFRALAGFLGGILPWVLYSMVHYHTPWASDNGFVVTSAQEVFVQDYRLPVETIFNHPFAWFLRVAGNALRTAANGGLAVLLFPPLVITLPAAIIRRPGNSPLLAAIAAGGLGLAGQILTGYSDLRYFSWLLLLISIWAACKALTNFGGVRLAVALIAVAGIFLAVRGGSATEGDQPPEGVPGGVVLAGSHLGYRFGAMTQTRTVCLPSDWERLTPAEQEQFIHKYQITKALLPVNGVPVIVPIADAIAMLRFR